MSLSWYDLFPMLVNRQGLLGILGTGPLHID